MRRRGFNVVCQCRKLLNEPLKSFPSWYCRSAKSSDQCSTFRACVVFSFSVCLDKLFRCDILVELSFKEYEYPVEPSCWGGLTRSQLWMWGSSSVQGFLHGGASLQCKAPFQDSSPLNLLLFHKMRSFSKPKEYTLPGFPPSHHNQFLCRWWEEYHVN